MTSTHVDQRTGVYGARLGALQLRKALTLLDLQGPGKKCYSRAGRGPRMKALGKGCRKEWEEAPDFLLLPIPLSPARASHWMSPAGSHVARSPGNSGQRGWSARAQTRAGTTAPGWGRVENHQCVSCSSLPSPGLECLKNRKPCLWGLLRCTWRSWR